jgi:hypothetical protein
MDDLAATQDIVVSGFSMRLILNPGDLVRVRRTGAAELSPGDIVVFLGERRKKALPVVHRLLWKRFREGSWTLWTKGDAVFALDPASPEASLIGKVTAIKKNDRPWSSAESLSGRLGHLALGAVSSLLFGLLHLVYAALRPSFLILSKLPGMGWLTGDVIDGPLAAKKFFPDEAAHGRP